METMTLNNMTMSNRSKLVLALMIALAICLMAASAQAGTGGTEFDGIWDLIKGWMRGTLGRIVAGGCVLTGLIAGWARGNLWAAVTGIGMGLCLFYAPNIIEGVVTAVI